MPELVLRERLQPSLLDRLIDDEPERREEPREARAISDAQLRELVRRDLAWLFNTTCLGALQDLRAWPEADSSVVNYGIPDLAGRTLSSIEASNMEKLLRDAIWNFEPRLLRHTVQLKVVVDKERFGQNALVFDIDAELWAQPLPISMCLRTEIDLENGAVVVNPRDEGTR
ncbi:MAG TPA: type VI secretion system baseplate subunit TssE [Polyangiales bacterium]